MGYNNYNSPKDATIWHRKCEITGKGMNEGYSVGIDHYSFCIKDFDDLMNHLRDIDKKGIHAYVNKKTADDFKVKADVMDVEMRKGYDEDPYDDQDEFLYEKYEMLGYFYPECWECNYDISEAYWIEINGELEVYDGDYTFN